MECDLIVLFFMFFCYYINFFNFIVFYIMCVLYVMRFCDKFNLKCKIYKILMVYLECNVCFYFMCKIEVGDL